MGSPTTNYGWTKPTVGGDNASWGTELNSSLDGIDSTVKSVSNVANAALPAASYTASDVLTKIKTVDGTGSGLDADKLEGQTASFYQNASNLNAGTLPTQRLASTVARQANPGSFGSANIWISSGAPSGGSSGDLWFQYS